MKRALIITGLLLLFLLFGSEKAAITQLSQPPPPPPIPGIPSILEDVRNTRHNLSSIPPDPAKFQELYGPGAERRVFTAETTEVCIFCHTPHGASTEGISAPLWNRSLSRARYVLYDQVWSTSFEGYEAGPKPNAPTGYSRLCLSCHDGTIALGTVINFPGSGSNQQGFLMSYAPGQTPAGGVSGTMPPGSGPSSGDTRLIGTSLQNDHPISFVFDSILANRDEELVDPGPALTHPSANVGDATSIAPMRRYPGADLTRYDSVQCTSCHNPHAATYPRFLRANYFNEGVTSKIICLYCHDKPGWTGSAHDGDSFVPPATPSSGNPYHYDGTHTVGQYACRACHDPHTAQGAKRLLREGVDAANNFAIENTCFLCHKPGAGYTGDPATFPPDIQSEFSKDTNSTGNGSAMNLTLNQRHEPVFVAHPQEGVELFSPAPPLFNEDAPGTQLRDTSHVECVDCHNPHQAIRTNRLKGMKGIDINGNVVGAKIPGNSREPYVHEVCLRCHGNSYTNLFTGDRYPDDKVTGITPEGRSVEYSPRSDPSQYAGTPANGPQFGLKGYSNKRKEFDPNTPDVAPDHTQQSANAAFHPVGAAGRNGTPALCNQLVVAFNLDCGGGPGVVVEPSQLNPTMARQALSNLTIQCTDCHNNNVFENIIKGPLTGLSDGTSYKRVTDRPSSPNPAYNSLMESYSRDPSTPQGPHGSGYTRILRARYNTDIMNPGRSYINDGETPSFWDNFNLCFQCHDRRAFDPYVGGRVDSTGEEKWTNFVGRVQVNKLEHNFWEGNLHKFHFQLSGAYCHECHNNVHSNVEAQNTLYGDGAGGGLPSTVEDGIDDNIVDTHLINFGPTVRGSDFAKPRWYKDLATNSMRCNLQCHQVDMRSCFYQAPLRSQGGPAECQIAREECLYD